MVTAPPGRRWRVQQVALRTETMVITAPAARGVGGIGCSRAFPFAFGRSTVARTHHHNRWAISRPTQNVFILNIHI